MDREGDEDLMQMAFQMLVAAEDEEEEEQEEWEDAAMGLMAIAMAEDGGGEERTSERGPRRTRDWSRFKNDFQKSDDQYFRELCRLSRPAFQQLASEMAGTPYFKFMLDARSVGLEAGLAHILTRFAHGTSLRGNARLGGAISASLAVKIERAWTGFVREYLVPKYIKWPEKEDWKRISEGFRAMTGTINFNGIIGAIDGTSIPIKNPRVLDSVYYDKDGIPAMKALAVCDDRGVFTYVKCGEPGSYGDGRSLSRSGLYNDIQNYIDDPKHFHLIGDSGFPLLEWLLIPFDHHAADLDEEKRKYNKALQKARVIIEHAFGRLKMRFLLATRQDLSKLHYTELMALVTSLFALHNFAILHHDEWRDDRDGEEDEDEEDDGPAVGFLVEGIVPESAAAKRQLIVQTLYSL
jgi:hypothetical protein